MRRDFERRLAALEDQRDRVVSRLTARYLARVEVLLGDQYDAWLDAVIDQAPVPADTQARLADDPEIARLDPVLRSLVDWRTYVEQAITPHRRRRVRR